ncbi:putative xyloglucan endotransglucosylase/hydrolase protein 2-like [Capsicum annuum]|nr:putative xyloglucan endotransglucosylase/hydrolase protein 2-like [Capsicum annuum]
MALMRKLIATSSVVVIFLVSTVFARNILQILSENEDGICTSMVETQGYGCEEHKVTTDDGYILSLQRIPKGISGKTATKPPVLLQHGLLMAYWEWSWDELVDFDLPATFKYVHDQTGQKLHYVGHSLGTLTAFGALSENKLVDMLRSAALLSPIAYLGQIKSPLAKMTRKGTIEKFDYGSDEENKKHYGQPNPPQYIMSNIPNDMPLFLAYGGKDYLSDVNDVKILLNKLQDHDPNKLVVQYREDYAHADFVFGTSAKEVLYNSIMAFFKLN